LRTKYTTSINHNIESIEGAKRGANIPNPNNEFIQAAKEEQRGEEYHS
jgi:hypothetical protein